MHRDRVCEDCGDAVTKRRIRCPKCKQLICTWCYYHVHKLAITVSTEDMQRVRMYSADHD